MQERGEWLERGRRSGRLEQRPHERESDALSRALLRSTKSTCQALKNTRNILTQFTRNYIEKLSEDIASVLRKICSPTNLLTCNFLLDASTLPEVISAVNTTDTKYSSTPTVRRINSSLSAPAW